MPEYFDISEYEKKFYCGEYDDLENFISYHYQIKAILSLKQKTILEIGIGNKTVSDYLKKTDMNIITCDINQNLFPDIRGNIEKLPLKNNSVDTILCCEVLEHIPFENIPNVLSELNRVMKNNLVISVPYNSFFIDISINLKIPHFRRLSGFLLRLPLFTKNFYKKEGHCWEMGYRNFSKKNIDNLIRKKFKVKHEFEPILYPYHYFYILQKL